MLTNPNLIQTANGAMANRSTGSHCLNFFAVCGALRSAEEGVSRRLFARAYVENRDLAMRALFYARDIREGLGERDVFRDILRLLAQKRPQSVRKNIRFVPEYGRWDDLLCLMGTPCEDDAVECIRAQLQRDVDALQGDAPVSLLAKWLPSVNTSSPQQRMLARLLCKHLGMKEKAYRRMLSQFRTQIDVLEKRLCRRDYSFDYAKQPSGAMHRYRCAFLRNDFQRYTAFNEQVLLGEKQMHAGTLYPYEIIRSCLRREDAHLLPYRSDWTAFTPELSASLDASWRSLPDYGDRRNALAIVDGSYSMYSGGSPKPIEIALSLGIYFAEHNTGFFRDCFMSFSRTPRLIRLEGNSIADRALYCAGFNEAANTNLRAALLCILDAAVENHLPQEQLPETLYIISDMEFDAGVEKDKTLFHEIRDAFAKHGYRLPAIVYWNVNSRGEQFPVRRDESGTVLVSGASPSIFRMVIGQNTSPEQYMRITLNSGRYLPICA